MKKSSHKKRENDELRERVVAAIESYKGTLRGFSRESGIPYGSLFAYASGKKKPGLDALAAIVKVSEVSPVWILSGEKEIPLKNKIQSVINERFHSSWSEFSRHAGISGSTLQQIKTGANPRAATLLKISEALGVSIDWLMSNECDRDQNPIEKNRVEIGSHGRLNEAIRKSGLTRSEVCRRSGIPYPTMSDYTVGKSKPGFDAICKIIRILNLNSDWFLFGEGEMLIGRVNRSESFPTGNNISIKPLRDPFGFRTLLSKLNIDDSIFIRDISLHSKRYRRLYAAMSYWRERGRYFTSREEKNGRRVHRIKADF
jgi:predicted transcriptional regulator